MICSLLSGCKISLSFTIWLLDEEPYHVLMCTTVYYFQFEVHIRNAAKHLAHLPPKTLPKPQFQPPSQFSVVKLRHVEQTLAETKPPPESMDSPAPSFSCHSAVLFMSRILQRLKEVDEHISEVNNISC